MTEISHESYFGKIIWLMYPTGPFTCGRRFERLEESYAWSTGAKTEKPCMADTLTPERVGNKSNMSAVRGDRTSPLRGLVILVARLTAENISTVRSVPTLIE